MLNPVGALHTGVHANVFNVPLADQALTDGLEPATVEGHTACACHW